MSVERRSLPARPESVPELRRAAVAFARHNGASEERCHAIALAVTEAATNAVVHAYRDHDAPGHIELFMHHDGRELRVAVCDEGMGMASRPDSPGLGLGMPLIARMADRLEVRTRDHGGTEVRMRFGVATETCTA